MCSTRGLPEAAQLAPGSCAWREDCEDRGGWAPPPSLHAGCPVSPWRLPVGGGGLGSPRLRQHLTQLLSKCDASQSITCTLGFKSDEVGMQAGLASRVCAGPRRAPRSEGRAPGSMLCGTTLEFFTILEQGTPHFRFALGSTNCLVAPECKTVH